MTARGGELRKGMRVLLTCDAVGGVWTYARDLALGFSGLGLDVTLVVLGPEPSTDQAAELGSSAGIRLIVPGLPLDWTAESEAELLGAGRQLAELARSSGAELVHLHAPALAAEAMFQAPLVVTCHSCLATWWNEVRSGPLPPDFAWRCELTGRGLRRAGALLAPTRAFARATAEVYGLGAAPSVVHNGHEPASPVRPLSGGETFAFTAGRLWDDGKNLWALDEAAAEADIPVLAAGPLEGPNGASIALSHIRPLGRLSRDEVTARLAERPIFVSAALYEPFGLSVLEAAAAGCPLLLSDIATFRELWDGAAAFVDPWQPAEIAQGLRYLAGLPERRERLGQLAAERAAKYGLDRFVAGTAAIYRDLLASDATAKPKLLQGAAA